MKRLVIIRHGKSSWDHPELKDHHRPLKQRGVNNAFSIASKLIELDIKPNLCLSSPAVRALDTAIIIATNMAYPLDKIVTNRAIYEASVATLLQVLSEVDNQHQTVFLFGHNPGFTALANALQEEQLANLPTCGTIAIDLEMDSWSEITSAKGTQVVKLIPKQLT